MDYEKHGSGRRTAIGLVERVANLASETTGEVI